MSRSESGMYYCYSFSVTTYSSHCCLHIPFAMRIISFFHYEVNYISMNLKFGLGYWIIFCFILFFFFEQGAQGETWKNEWALSLPSLAALGRSCFHCYLKSQIICWMLRDRWLRISHYPRWQLNNFQKEIHRWMSEPSKIKKTSQLSLIQIINL